jgi:hypothetical protein
MKIDKKKYDISEQNFYITSYDKTQLILASSLRKDSNHLVRLKHKDFGKSKKWNTFTITRNGLIYQHYDPKCYTDFIGVKQADKQSISIVLENMGYLIETPNGKYINWINETCDKSNVLEKKWMGYSFWEKHPDKQIQATIELCDKLCTEFNIERNLIEFRNYHKDILKFKGIVFRSNYFEESGDVNPNIDISKFNEMLHNENS